MTADQSFSSETKRVKLWLDADVIDWFKAQQGGARGYQTKINAALRKVVEGGAWEGGVSLGVKCTVTVTLGIGSMIEDG